MLHDFLTSNRKELISRCKAKVAKRSPKVSAADGSRRTAVPAAARRYPLSRAIDNGPHGVRDRGTPAHTEIGRAAALHGTELLRNGYSVDQVVHDYGDVCQAVTELAVEQKALITVDEFRTLNRCLDNAIADAVTAYARVARMTQGPTERITSSRMKLRRTSNDD